MNKINDYVIFPTMGTYVYIIILLHVLLQNTFVSYILVASALYVYLLVNSLMALPDCFKCFI